MGFIVNLAGKALHILRLCHPFSDDLSIAGDGGQGRFQLVRHVGGELSAQLVLLLVRLTQRLHLVLDLLVLSADAPHQGAQLRIHVPLVWILQADAVDGFDDTLRHPISQKGGQPHRQHQHSYQRLELADQQGHHCVLGARQAQDGAIVQAQGVVGGLAGEGAGITGALPLASLHGLFHLIAVGMVLHILRLGHAVEQYSSVSVDPGDAVGAVFGQLGLEEGLAPLLYGSRCIGCFFPLFALARLGEIAIQRPHEQSRTGHEHGHGHQEHMLKQFPPHLAPLQSYNRRRERS